MNTFSKVFELQQFLSTQNNKTIGFVPTMGALHDGHLALVKRSLQENEITVVSIFVNPIQFNNPDDLNKYPRTLEKDLALLDKIGCNVVFTPNEQEMYPNGKPTDIHYHFGALETVMEGAHRPGHFNGVAIVVKRLFDIVKPHKAYFGEKDYQQLLIITELVKQENLPVSIIPCNIVREPSGLAMSSRNERLSPEDRKNAAIIYKTLTEIQQNSSKKSLSEWKQYFTEKVNAVSPFRVEYIEFANAQTLQPITHFQPQIPTRAFVSVYCNSVRLIDNIAINNPK